ncbi:MAG: hypothetical protein ABW115_22665 [Candidatus Thiodiazotropha sp. 6PLUC6]
MSEIRQLPASELTGWIAYFSLQQNSKPSEPTPDQQYAQMRKVLG